MKHPSSGRDRRATLPLASATSRSRREFLRTVGLGGAALALPGIFGGCVTPTATLGGGEVDMDTPVPPGAPPEIRLTQPAGVVLDQYDVGEQGVTVVDENGPVADAWAQFSSSDESIAVVSPRGFVFGLRPGAALITVTAHGVSRTFDVIVREPIAIRHTAASTDVVVQGFTSDAINEALRQAAARGPGSVVFLPAGTYAITSRIEIPASDLVLRGAGRRATWLVAGPEMARESSVETIRVDAVDRVLIEELGLRYASTDGSLYYGAPPQIGIYGSTGTRVHRCAFEAGKIAYWNVFIGWTADGSRPSFRSGVTECQADGSRTHGVEINNSDECFVERSVITRATGNSIEPYHRFGGYLRGSIIRDNYLLDPEVACVSVHSDVETHIIGNVMRGGGGNGVVLYVGPQADLMSRTGICELNDIRGSGRLNPNYSSGILAALAEGWTIRRNVVRDNRCYGIILSGTGNQVLENHCTENDSCGLIATGRNHRVNGNDFSNNAVKASPTSETPAIKTEATDIELSDNLADDTRPIVRHHTHYHVRGTGIQLLRNRGKKANTILGAAACIDATNIVVTGNEDVNDFVA